MGGVDGGVCFDVTTSPRQAAIEKAQAELRQEYDVREERKRELEFLEKGGNPLDFKFSLSASISVQSTSVTDQLLEHEAKGSVALATSPHGDSAESSGHPGVPSLREPNFADNLMLFDTETSKGDGKRNGLNTGKRKTIASFEQPSTFDGNISARETEDSAIFHLGVKNQAYARRYRLKTSHDGAQFGPLDLTEASRGNQTTLLSTQADGDAVKIQHWKTHVDNHIPVSNTEPISLSRNNDSKNVPCEGRFGTELDAAQNNETCVDLQEASAAHASITSEKLHENNLNNHQSVEGSEQNLNAMVSTSSKLVDTRGEILRNCVAQACFESAKQSEGIGKSCTSGFAEIDEEAQILQNQDQVEKFVSPAGSDNSTHCDLEAEPTYAKVNHVIDGNATGDRLYSGELIGPCNGGRKEKKTVNESMPIPGNMRDNRDLLMDDAKPDANKEQNNAFPSARKSPTKAKDEEYCDNKLNVHDGKRPMSIVENIQVVGEFLSKPEGKFDSSPPHLSDVYQETLSESTRNANLASPIFKHLEVSLSQKCSATIPEHQSQAGENIKMGKTHEESILREAHLIETKLKRAQESPLCILHSVNQRKSHWDYVLEEMTWLANDFMQERLWKITTASQICHMVATSGRMKIKNNLCMKQKSIAHILAKAVIRFWTSFEENKNVDEKMQIPQLPIKHYAARFLQSESCAINVVPAEAPKTPDRTSDAGSLESPRQEQILDDLLFYKVPFGSMHAYRKSVETEWLHHEKTRKITNHLDSEGDFAAEIKMPESIDDDDVETTMCYMPNSLEVFRPKGPYKGRKILQRKAGAFDLPYVPGIKSKMGTQPPTVVGKRTSGTKRNRIGPRPRASPLSVSSTGAVPVTSKTDASSGDTSSFQDDQSTFQGGFYPRKGSEFESTVDFEKQQSFDVNEAPVNPKTGELNSRNFFSSRKGSSEQKWPVDSYAQLEQKDHIKKRLEGRQSKSNGTIGVYIQQATKKPKTFNKLIDTSHEALVPLSGPIPSPVASQMSNMSNSNKTVKVIPNRDRSRKNKALKIISGQATSGGLWSQFEDQTLVVLVHDMGPNWELISDAINSTVRFKSLYRDPKSCKDRHKILMDKNAGDGADSAEDSGSSQPYPSTLPGIPKGSARQLFECLQGPIEEDTLKAHFEKIIHIGQKMHSRRLQKDNLDSKQICLVHNSHVAALSQACPNNLAGGPLTPLDLCDASTSNSTEVLGLGYQGSSSSGLAPPGYQGPTSTILPAPGPNNMLQGSPSMVIGNSFPSAAANAPTRDGPRYGFPRPASLPVDDQQRLQQYGQPISGRNVPGALSMAADRGIRMLSSANGVGMVGGMSRGMPLTRPGFQGIGSPGVLNMVSAGSMPPSTSVGVPNPANIHPGPGQAQGNSMMRPRDSLHMLRSGQNIEDHRQMMQELQQATQGNGQTIASFNGISAPFSNQPITAPPVQSFPVQQNQPHQMAQQSHILGNTHHTHMQQGTNHNSPQQQAYAMRIAKERQLQQQRLGPPFSGSNGTPQQNNPQLQQTAQSSLPMTTVSSSHAQQKQQNLARNPQSAAILTNQTIKQRQRHPIQQQLPRQQQNPPSQAKLMKGSSRGGILMHQNSPVDTSNVNNPVSGNQILEKHMLQQNQSMLSGNPSSNSNLQQKTSQQKVYGRSPSQSSKQMSAVPSHPDGVSQGQLQAPGSQALLSSQQSQVHNTASQNQVQRQTNQPHQTMHRVGLHQNHKLNSDNHIHAATDSVQSSQMMVSPTKSSDSANAIPDTSSASVSASPWKSEQSYETSSRAPSALLSNSSQPIMDGKESLMSASNQGLAQRQFPGNYPVHAHGGSGGPWHQQQPQQQQQSYTPHQQIHHQAGQGVVYGKPANTGPG